MPTAEEMRAALARQLRQHLESLRSAGVDFVPATAPIAFTIPQSIASATIEPELRPETLTRPLPVESEKATPSTQQIDLTAPITVSPSADLFAEAQPTVPSSAADRRHELTLLAQRISTCDRCPELYATRTQTVFGVGQVEPDICFIGEAPGADEDATGEPFVGRAGQLLNKIIAACGFQRQEVYICNTIKCRPPNNRVPSPTERGNCRDYFDTQIALVKPKYIVCLGATAAQNVLGSTLGIGKLRGKVHKYKTTPVVCTYHPAALLRDEARKKDTWEDMKMLLRTMGRPIPGAKT